MTTDKVQIATERQRLLKRLNRKVPLRQVDDNILVATWNIAHFSEKKTNRALQYIADICERFDIIALQEVKTNLQGLSKLQDLLPGHYKILVSDPSGNNERLAFLYDERTVISTGHVCEIAFHGTIEDPNAFQFHRTPYCASFRAGRFDFTLISVHIVEGSNWGKIGRDARKHEIERLVTHIKEEAGRKRNTVFDPDFLLVGISIFRKMVTSFSRRSQLVMRPASKCRGE